MATVKVCAIDGCEAVLPNHRYKWCDEHRQEAIRADHRARAAVYRDKPGAREAARARTAAWYAAHREPPSQVCVVDGCDGEALGLRKYCIEHRVEILRANEARASARYRARKKAAGND
ncbi:hypothetical protein GCM10022286_05670 [Gryllotalpicola daejeonensis]|uniref:HNH endonuclease n=1 Tax=Gryllotalpicola daejeonensis TaxID=993087 RepID=A0ABP7ZIJ0_9MICO